MVFASLLLQQKVLGGRDPQSHAYGLRVALSLRIRSWCKVRQGSNSLQFHQRQYCKTSWKVRQWSPVVSHMGQAQAFWTSSHNPFGHVGSICTARLVLERVGRRGGR